MTWSLTAQQVIKANGDDADTYRCYASNEFGEAVCSVTLIIIERKWTWVKGNPFNITVTPV